MMKKRYLILEDGTVYEGAAIGADRSCIGELVFTTGMCGYTETLTDPSYFGQIVLQTFPLIGNYGISEADFEGKCAVSGYIVREACEAPSNFRCEYTLNTFLKRNGIPGICGVDTRDLTKKIREHGVMNAMLADAVPVSITEIKEYTIQNAVNSVTRTIPETFSPESARYRVTLIDYGAKRNIIRELVRRGCTVTAVPAGTCAAEILAGAPDGIMLSNGPGDPAENTTEIEVLRTLLGKIPIFGICLGHQLMALALGAETEKLKYGHRGVNQPVRDMMGTRTYMTSQNHGYAVVPKSLKTGVLRYINANDGTCEGIDYPELSAFSVQFHPEACGGPHDTSFLFDRFLAVMKERRDCDAAR